MRYPLNPRFLSNMSHLYSFVNKSLLALLYFGDMLVALSPVWHFPSVSGSQKHMLTTTRRFIEPTGCVCNILKCECCSRIHSNPPHKVCINITLVPNELTLKTGLLIDDKDIYEGTIDPSSAPICVPNLPGICLVVNHVNIQQLQVCTKLNYIFLTVVKFPCTTIQDGKLSFIPNVY